MQGMLAHYRIVRNIGRGGMGEVWLAEDTKLQRQVALKIIFSDVAAHPARVHRFLREAHAAAKLNHPNIAVIHEVGERDDSSPFIAMEYVEGRTLAELIAQKPLSPNRVLELGVEIADALDEAREKGIVHRDLKPSNIIVNSRGHAKVLDFGLAKLNESIAEDADASTEFRSDPGLIVGTVHYMSPEQALGQDVDHRSDLFSLGATLYQMATARLPFGSGTATAITDRIIHEEPEPIAQFNQEVPQELERIIRKCLEKDRERRYQTAREIVVDLKNVQRGDHRVRQIYRWQRPRAIAAALVLITVVAVWVVTTVRRERGDVIAQTAGSAVAAYPRTSVAVLPLQNLSPEVSHTYFAGGLHDEILTQLSKVAALKVISRTSVMSFAGSDLPRLKDIAKELGVGTIVEGSVQVIGDRLRVNVQLIDAGSDVHLWAERYDRTLDDAFAVQTDIASRIVAAVGATLTRSEYESIVDVPTSSGEAYRLYLEARESASRPGWLKENLTAAERLYSRALSIDPSFALARAALSNVHGAMYHLRLDPTEERAAQTRQEAEAALRLAPDLPEAHFALGLAHYYTRRDYEKALQELSIAKAGLPNDVRVLRAIGLVYRRLGNWTETISALERCRQLDPRNSFFLLDLGGLTYLVMHRYDEAARTFARVSSLSPDLHSAAVFEAQAHFHETGNLDPLRAVLQRIPGDESLGAFGTIYSQRATLLLWDRKPDELLQTVAASKAAVFEGSQFFLPVSLYAGWAHRLRGEESAARDSFEVALARLDSEMRQIPDDWRIHAARGLALAGLGRRTEALDEAQWIKNSQVYTRDAFSGPAAAEARAAILAQSGEVAAAIEQIERLVAEPSWLSVHSLAVDPLWDPLRPHPRFNRLLQGRRVR